jgi:Rps23 Pro-64 3,4-dihydroxylase Tpa1-like proline 4-hydroxylase
MTFIDMHVSDLNLLIARQSVMLLDKTVQVSSDRPLIATAELHHTNLLAGQDRLKSVTKALKQEGCHAVLLNDPINIRYATDTSNMQIWTMHNFERYALVFADRYVVLWDFFNCDHLSETNRQADEIRTAIYAAFFLRVIEQEKKQKRGQTKLTMCCAKDWVMRENLLLIEIFARYLTCLAPKTTQWSKENR